MAKHSRASISFPENHPWWLRYGASLGAAIAATAISAALVHAGLQLHSTLMITAVVVTAWFGGFGPGLFTLLLTLPAEFLLRAPVATWRIDGEAGWAGLGLYVMNAVIICALFRKRYFQRSRSRISPVAVSGGWIWKFDPADGGIVTTQSPEFPALSITRTFPMWLNTVHPGDRPALERQIRSALSQQTLTARYRLAHDDGVVQLVSMLGVRVSNQAGDYIVATCIEMGPRQNPEQTEWTALPLG